MQLQRPSRVRRRPAGALPARFSSAPRNVVANRCSADPMPAVRAWSTTWWSDTRQRRRIAQAPEGALQRSRQVVRLGLVEGLGVRQRADDRQRCCYRDRHDQPTGVGDDHCRVGVTVELPGQPLGAAGLVEHGFWCHPAHLALWE